MIGNLLVKISMLILASIALCATTFGQENVSNEMFRDVAGELRCPTCTGLSVLESDASFSVSIKDTVKEKLSKGETKEEILSFFVERYGPWILREPPKKGFGFLAWAVPLGFLVLGPFLVWFFVWRRKVEHTNWGMRSSDVILEEMKQEILSLKQQRGN